MSDKNLTQRLKALANEEPEFEGRARVVPHADALSTILQEIDAAVLPVNLVFDGGQSQMTLHVAERRLHSIIEVTGDLQASEDVIGQSVSTDNEALLAEVSKLLHAFADSAEKLLLTTAEAKDDAADATNSVSVSTLAKSLECPDPNDDRPPSEKFLAALADIPSAIMHVENGVVSHTEGSVVHTASLKIAVSQQLSRFLKEREQKCPSHSDPSFTVFSDVIEPGQSLGLCILENLTVIFVFPATQLETVHATYLQSIQ